MPRRTFASPNPKKPPGLRKKARTDKAEFAKKLRANPTHTESILWEHLRKRLCDGLRFRRQAIVSGWIADFYCASLRLIVEVDGPSHASREKQDEYRDQVLARAGISTLRLEASLVEEDVDMAVNEVKAMARKIALESHMQPNKALHRTAILLRSVAADELRRSLEKGSTWTLTS